MVQGGGEIALIALDIADQHMGPVNELRVGDAVP